MRRQGRFISSPRDLRGSTRAGPSHGFWSSCLHGEHYWQPSSQATLTHSLEHNFSFKGLLWWPRSKTAMGEAGFSQLTLSEAREVSSVVWRLNHLTSCTHSHLAISERLRREESILEVGVGRVQYLPALPASWEKHHSLFWPVCTCNLPSPYLKTYSQPRKPGGWIVGGH